MSKIVILIGSMRKGGNTQLLAQAFAEGAGKRNDVEIISVVDYKVNPFDFSIWRISAWCLCAG